MPLVHRHAQVLPDGRLLWELPDTEANRKLAESMLPTRENPPFAYSFEIPGKDVKVKSSAAPQGSVEEAAAKALADAAKADAKKSPKEKPAPKGKAAKAAVPLAIVQEVQPTQDPQPDPPARKTRGPGKSRPKEEKSAPGGK